MYNYGVGSGAFVNDRNVAMIADWSDVLSKLSDMRAKGKPMNWDMATHPNFADNMGKGRDVGAHAYYMYNKSKKKDAVFQAIQYLVDEEAQRIANRQGKLTILTKTDVFKKEYGQDVAELQGKNKEAIFKMTPTATVTHEYYSIVSGALNKATEAFALKQKDLNTALKDAEEEANKLIAEQEAAKK
jgi:multiple sugar transport system substrate-binding protein